MSMFGNEREQNKGKVVALVQVTKDGEAKILEGNSLNSFLKLWDQLIGLLILRGGIEEQIKITWTPLKGIRIERKKK